MTYVITARHHMYAPAKDITDFAGWDPDARGGNGAPAIYSTRADALAALAEIDTGRYYTRHGESGRPAYRVRTVASLPQYLAVQL